MWRTRENPSRGICELKCTKFKRKEDIEEKNCEQERQQCEDKVQKLGELYPIWVSKRFKTLIKEKELGFNFFYLDLLVQKKLEIEIILRPIREGGKDCWLFSSKKNDVVFVGEQVSIIIRLTRVKLHWSRYMNEQIWANWWKKILIMEIGLGERKWNFSNST